jgi:hypothetical protein
MPPGFETWIRPEGPRLTHNFVSFTYNLLVTNLSKTWFFSKKTQVSPVVPPPTNLLQKPQKPQVFLKKSRFSPNNLFQKPRCFEKTQFFLKNLEPPFKNPGVLQTTQLFLLQKTQVFLWGPTCSPQALVVL